ncbi:thiamine phosphate synthase [Teredinibacter haidensis]|uniref:thiamine phosphate synthase n=1 Tax=Teredinibacter haidensis TaxID=2731755 RepID=UPI000948BC32|nr:thiamine phosphate synthase [Teredinibacter haidensis]
MLSLYDTNLAIDGAPLIWAVGGSDSRAGAGIQADLLTAQDLGACCCTIVTAVTAQSARQVAMVQAVDPRVVEQQLNTLLEDGRPQLIKVGLVATQEQVEVIAKWLQKNPVELVLDPVQIASNQDGLTVGKVDLSPLFSYCKLITPNKHEIDALGGIEKLSTTGARAVLVTGKKIAKGQLADCLYEFGNSGCKLWRHTRIDSINSHGTGCTLATAITVFSAQGFHLADAITQAIAYVRNGLLTDEIGSTNHSVSHKGWPGNSGVWPMAVETKKRDGIFDSEAVNRDITFPSLKQPLGFYPVVDSFEWVKKLIDCGVRTIQLRIKNAVSQKNLRCELAEAIAYAEEAEAQLFINDHWQLACDLKAYGVHLGQEDLETANLKTIVNAGLRLGISTHGFFELSVALSCKPSYYALGHIFATTTKEMPSSPQGLSRLSKYASLMRDFPIVAIGGINLLNAEKVMSCGVSSIAVVRSVTESENLPDTIRKYSEIFHSMKYTANIDKEALYADICE